MTTVAEVLEVAAARLTEAGVPDARREAQWLLGSLLRCDRGVLVARGERTLAPAQAERFDAWVARRAAREPFQHIVGVQEFHGLDFEIDRRALVPRPETELLVDVVLEAAPPEGGAVADFGTGSGCIAITLAVRRPDLRVLALDSSAPALDLAAANAARHGVAGRVTFARTDLSDGADRAALAGSWRGRLAAIVSNPPYVAADAWETLEPEVRDHDPRGALVPGPSGLEAFPVVVAVAGEWLAPGGLLAVEVGAGQAAAVRRLAERRGLVDVDVRSDLAGIERVVSARAPAGGGERASGRAG